MDKLFEIAMGLAMLIMSICSIILLVGMLAIAWSLFTKILPQF